MSEFAARAVLLSTVLFGTLSCKPASAPTNSTPTAPVTGNAEEFYAPEFVERLIEHAIEVKAMTEPSTVSVPLASSDSGDSQFSVKITQRAFRITVLVDEDGFVIPNPTPEIIARMIRDPSKKKNLIITGYCVGVCNPSCEASGCSPDGTGKCSELTCECTISNPPGNRICTAYWGGGVGAAGIAIR